MRHSTGRNLFAVMFFTLCLLCGGNRQAAAAETIRINGSGSALFMMKPLIKAYTKTHPGVRIEMEKPLGSSGAIKALLAGVLDIAVSSKALKPEDSAKGAVSREFGKTPLAIVTGKNVLKTDITTKELEDIYSGKVRIWPNGEQIRLVLRPEADIDSTIIERLSPDMGKAIKTAHAQQGMIIAVTDPESDEAVTKTQGSLGAAALPAVLVEKVPFNILALNGVRPSLTTLRNGTYPLAKDIRFITTKNSRPEVATFLNFIYSPQGRAIAEKAGVLSATAAPAK